MAKSKKPKSKKPQEPTDKVKLILYFDTEQGRENFSAWYLDGGGEQGSRYYAGGRWADGWMYLAPPGDACPECEYCDEDEINGYFYTNRDVRTMTVRCGNCEHGYQVKNRYPLRD